MGGGRKSRIQKNQKNTLDTGVGAGNENVDGAAVYECIFSGTDSIFLSLT